MKTLLLAAILIAASKGVTMAENVPLIFKTKSGTEVLYRLTSPKKAEAGKQYPLVLFLHGAGERGSDNKVQLKHGVNDILKGAAALGESIFLIAPQCPANEWWTTAAPDRCKRKEAGVKESLTEAVLALIDETAEKHPIDPKRIYITGLSMGGYGTWDMLARSPQTWAAAIPICGGGDPSSVRRFKQIPIWIFHGDADEVVPAKNSELMAAALEDVNGKAELTMYPGVGHDSWTQTYKNLEVIKWLFAQKK